MGESIDHAAPVQRSLGSRMANLELLRCVAMMMVVALHYLGKGNLLGDLTEPHMGTTGYAAWILEAFCIVAVNVYMLLSGYFLCLSRFKPSRLLRLYLQIWMYSALVGLFSAAVGLCPREEVDIHYLLTLIFPVSMGHYWFMTAYVFLYLLLPLVGMAVRRMSRRQMRLVLGLLLFTFCMLKTVLPVRLETDGQGYDVIWYLCVFCTAAYFRRFGSGFLERRGAGVCLYLAGCAGAFGELMLLRGYYLKTGGLGRIMKVSMEYNHLFPFLAAVGLFAAFLRLRVSGRPEGIVNRIGPCTLGVYLLHENLGLRYRWQEWFGAGAGGMSVAGLLWHTVLAVAVMFFLGVLAEMARETLVRRLHRGLLCWKPYRKAADKVKAADELFRENNATDVIKQGVIK